MQRTQLLAVLLASCLAGGSIVAPSAAAPPFQRLQADRHSPFEANALSPVALCPIDPISRKARMEAARLPLALRPYPKLVMRLDELFRRLERLRQEEGSRPNHPDEIAVWIKFQEIVRWAIRIEDRWLAEVAGWSLKAFDEVLQSREKVSALAILFTPTESVEPLAGRILASIEDQLRERAPRVVHVLVPDGNAIREFHNGQREEAPPVFRVASQAEFAALRSFLLEELVSFLVFQLFLEFQMACSRLGQLRPAREVTAVRGKRSAMAQTTEFHIHRDLELLGLGEPYRRPVIPPSSLPTSEQRFPGIHRHLEFLQKSYEWYLDLAGLMPFNWFVTTARLRMRNFSSVDAFYDALVASCSGDLWSVMHAMRGIEDRLHAAAQSKDSPIIVRLREEVNQVLDELAGSDDKTRAAWLARAGEIDAVHREAFERMSSLPPAELSNFTIHLGDSYSLADYAWIVESLISAAPAGTKSVRFQKGGRPPSRYRKRAPSSLPVAPLHPRLLLMRFLDPEPYRTNVRMLIREHGELPIAETNLMLKGLEFLGIIEYEKKSSLYRVSDWVADRRGNAAFEARLLDIVSKAPWETPMRYITAWQESVQACSRLRIEYPAPSLADNPARRLRGRLRPYAWGSRLLALIDPSLPQEDRTLITRDLRRGARDVLMPMLFKFAKESGIEMAGSTILSIGLGETTGELINLAEAAPFAAQVIGVEAIAEQVRAISNGFSRIVPEIRDRILLYHALPARMSRIPDDFATFIQAYAWVESQDVVATVSELVRVLEPGGLLYAALELRDPQEAAVLEAMHSAVENYLKGEGQVHKFDTSRYISFLLQKHTASAGIRNQAKRLPKAA